MEVKLILPAIGSVFILLAFHQLVKARKAPSKAIKVYKRLATVFFLAGTGLIGFYWLSI